MTVFRLGTSNRNFESYLFSHSAAKFWACRRCSPLSSKIASVREDEICFRFYTLCELTFNCALCKVRMHKALHEKQVKAKATFTICPRAEY